MRYRAIASLAVALAMTAACSKPAPQSADPQALPAQAADPQPAVPQSTGLPPSHGMVMTTTIVITNSGSTNTIGYRILIGATGEASFVSGDGPGNATLPAALFAKLKGDVDAAKPLSGLPRAGSGIKSPWFRPSAYWAPARGRADRPP